ncbi:MAG: tape measure protein [Ilumatobacteraceae bacterium]
MANAFTLFGEINVDTSSLDSGLNRAERSLNRATASMNQTGKAADNLNTRFNNAGTGATNFGRGIEGAASKASEFGGILTTVGAGLTAAITVPLTALGYAAFNTSLNMESLEMGLKAVMGSAEAAKKEIALLEEVAKLPGLGMEEALEGSLNLQATGLSAETSRRALQSFGNALATVGKGKNELKGVITALSQIQSKGKVSAEEINQIAERVPQIRKVMQDAFGTADTEVLQKLGISSEEFLNRVIGELEKLPAVGTSAKGALENFADATNKALKPIGDAIVPLVIAAVERIAPVIETLANGFKNLPGPVQQAIVIFGALLAALGPVLVVIGGIVMAAGGIAASIATLGGMAVITPILVSVAVIAGKVLLAIGALVAISYVLYKAWTTNFGGIQDKVQSVVDVLTALWDKHGAYIKDQFNRIWMIIKTVFDQISDYVMTVIGIVDALFKGEWSQAWDLFTGYVERTWERVKDVIAMGASFLLNAIIKVIGEIIPAWLDFNKRMVGAIWDFIQKIPGLLKEFALFLWDGVKSAIKGLWSLVSEIPGWVVSLGKAIVDGIRNGFSDEWQSFKSSVVSNIKGLVGLGSVAKQASGGIKEVGTAAEESKGFIDRAKEAVDNFVKSLGGGAGAGGGGGRRGGGGGGGVKSASQEAAEAIKSLREEMARFGAETRVQQFDIDVTLGKYAKWTQAQRDNYRELLQQRDNLDANSKALDAFNKRVEDVGKAFEQARQSTQPAQTELQKVNEQLKDVTALNAYAASVGMTADQVARLWREIAQAKDMAKAFSDDLKGGAIDISGMLPTPDKDNMPGIGGRRPVLPAEGTDEPPPIAPWETWTGSILEKIRKLKSEMPSFTESLSNAVVNFAQGVGDVFVEAIRNWDGTFKGFFKSVLQGFGQLVQQILAELLKIQIMKAVFSLFPSLAPAGAGTGAVTAASGGLIRGRGTGTSDSIPAMLSNGEYVIPADMVRKFGVGFFEQIRGGMMPGMAAPMPSAASVANNSSVVTNQNTFNISVPAGAPAGASGSMIQREILSALQKSQRRNR